MHLQNGTQQEECRDKDSQEKIPSIFVFDQSQICQSKSDIIKFNESSRYRNWIQKYDGKKYGILLLIGKVGETFPVSRELIKLEGVY